MKVLVTGTRLESKAIYLVVARAMTNEFEIYSPDLVVHGCCPTGVDQYAHTWFKDLGIEVRIYPADWERYGDSAGPRRNSLMLAREHTPDDKIDLVLAFPALDSKGTWDCVRKAADLGIEVHIYPV